MWLFSALLCWAFFQAQFRLLAFIGFGSNLLPTPHFIYWPLLLPPLVNQIFMDGDQDPWHWQFNLKYDLSHINCCFSSQYFIWNKQTKTQNFSVSTTYLSPGFYSTCFITYLSSYPFFYSSMDPSFFYAFQNTLQTSVHFFPNISLCTSLLVHCVFLWSKVTYNQVQRS